MKRVPLIRYMVLLMTFVIFCSCSVKEDRANCPNWILLVIDDSKYGEGRVLSDLSCALAGEGDWSEIRYLNSVGKGSRYAFEVPDGAIDCLVCAGRQDGLQKGKGLFIPYGSECPELYTHSSRLVVDSSWQTDTLKLHKNYCNVSFHLESMFASVGGKSITYMVTGSVCGCDMEAEPMSGPYKCETVPDSGMRGSIRIPRQQDSSLKLSIVVDGQIARTFPLGRYIEMSGYDWTAEDLSDVEVEIVFEMTETQICINMFGNEVELEISV